MCILAGEAIDSKRWNAKFFSHLLMTSPRAFCLIFNKFYYLETVLQRYEFLVLPLYLIPSCCCRIARDSYISTTWFFSCFENIENIFKNVGITRCSAGFSYISFSPLWRLYGSWIWKEKKLCRLFGDVLLDSCPVHLPSVHSSLSVYRREVFCVCQKNADVYFLCCEYFVYNGGTSGC